MYRLLIVDSRQAVCDRIRSLLDWSTYGFTSVLTATSYPEAVDIAVDLKPHIALVSLQLGDQPGYDLARQLRAAGMKTIFCVMADTEDPRHMRSAMQCGVRDYLPCPVKAQALQEFVERTISEDLHGSLPHHTAHSQDTDPVLGLEFSRLSSTTRKIILYIMGNYRHSLSLTSIAEGFNMSGKYIGRVFLKDTGIRFTEYLMSYRMIEARHLIVSTQEKISVIARMVGYSQLNNFYIHFKNYFGVSPSSLRHFDVDGTPEETNAPGGL